MILGYIPSPPSNAIHLGPLQLRAYGVAIALGIYAALVIARRRWRAAGGDPDDIVRIATWAVPAGLIGARLYHVATDYRRFQGRWLEALAVWKGGLGIPGGLLLGVITGIVVARRRGLAVPRVLDAVAPAIPVAQAIGRIGNYFNQELFGRPSGLPWAVWIDEIHRPSAYAEIATFHPTFAYEAAWNLALAGLLVVVARRPRHRAGDLFLLYVAGYGAVRLWLETLRIDEATRLLGLRINIWTSMAAIIGAAVVYVLRRRTGAQPGQMAESTAAR